MTEQQYRVIADRDRGDYLPLSEMQVGDVLWSRSVVTGDASVRHFNPPKPHRIERPVPTTDKCPECGGAQTPTRMHKLTCSIGEAEIGSRLPSPHLPTREQIAEVTDEILDALNVPAGDRASEAEQVDAIIRRALLQKEADRG